MSYLLAAQHNLVDAKNCFIWFGVLTFVLLAFIGGFLSGAKYLERNRNTDYLIHVVGIYILLGIALSVLFITGIVNLLQV